MARQTGWKHNGAISELVATTWLLNDGYDVFRNVSQHGAADIVAIKGKDIHLFDVKSANYTKDGPVEFLRLQRDRVELGIRIIAVYPDNRCVITKTLPFGESAYSDRICKYCNLPFTPTRPDKFFCKKSCVEASQRDKQRSIDADIIKLRNQGV